MEDENFENVEKINNTKDKKTKMKKVLPIVATVVVVFLGANVYASTQGYNNIFFAIKNLVKPQEEITNREEILEDRDITISYQPIDIAENVNLQINKLIVNGNEATLQLTIDEKYPLSSKPAKYAVYDITGGKKIMLGEQKNDRKNAQIVSEVTNGDELSRLQYIEKVKLSKLKNDTKDLQLEIINDKDELMVSFRIDIQNKEIDIISSANKFKKISETELKKTLGFYALLNKYDVFSSDSDFYKGKDDFNNQTLVDIAILMLKEKDTTFREDGYSKDEVSEVIKEICGKDVGAVNMKYSAYKYDKSNESYKYDNDGVMPNTALCLDVQDISFYDGIYTVDFVYCYASDVDFAEQSIMNLEKFKSTIKLKVNENYKHTKYCITNLEEMKYEPYIDEKIDVMDKDTDYTNVAVTKPLNPSANTITVANTISANTASRNTISTNTTNTISANTTSRNTISANTISANTISANTVSTNTVNENIITAENSVIDNYASSLEWRDYTSPGLKFSYPEDWKVTHIAEAIRGHNPGGAATMVEGVAVGIDRSTDEIISSYVTISMVEPEIIKGYNSIEDYVEYRELNCAGYSARETGSSGKWYDFYTETGYRTVYESVHLEELEDGSLQKYSIIICHEGEFNYKVVNILNWFFASIELRPYNG